MSPSSSSIGLGVSAQPRKKRNKGKGREGVFDPWEPRVGDDIQVKLDEEKVVEKWLDTPGYRWILEQGMYQISLILLH